jgi:hypothetical protein
MSPGKIAWRGFSLFVGAASMVVVGYWASSSGLAHDPLREFFLALILVVICNVIPFMSTVINMYWRLSGIGLKGADRTNHAESLVRAPLSAAIGLIEQTLYIYFLTSSHQQYVGSLLLFKAFFGWLTLQNANDTDHQKVLMKFYVYAIGNLMSLAFAILFFEIVHLSGPRFKPWLLSLYG